MLASDHDLPAINRREPNLKTKLMDVNFVSQKRSEVVLTLADKVASPLGLQMYTANDATKRDPVSWSV